MNQSAFNFEILKTRLDNGLEVILHKDNSIPIVAVNLWYKVGSANEKKGKTGYAHLFEHMMFQGSLNVAKEMHFKYIQEAGGTLNGSTSMDRTNYYEKVPSNYLELALWLESDRMGYLLPALTQEKLDNQKDVVMNERRQRYENQPYGLAWELLFSNLYPDSHPYSWPTIGWMEDIANFELQDIISFFNTYYAPNNASLVISGDIENNHALDLAKKYFSDIPSGGTIPPINYDPVSLADDIRLEHKDDVELPRVYLAWHSDKLYGRDDADLDIIADILSGSKASRLYKSLVFEKRIAQDVSCFQYSGRLAGSFIIVSTAKPGVSTDRLKGEITAELERLILEGITDEELNKSINSVKSAYIYSLQNLDVIANQINNYNCNKGVPNFFAEDIRRYETRDKITIQKAAEKYLSLRHIELKIIKK